MRPYVLAALWLIAAGCRTASTPAPTSPVAPAPSAPPADPAAEHRLPHEPPDAAVCDERLGALLWFQTSAEFRVLATSIYGAASRALDEALADPAWSGAVEQPDGAAALPPAVIVDVDETVLDNSAYEAESVLVGRRFEPVSWGAWIEKAEAEAIPGAVEFARQAAARGVTIFYVTNRNAGQEAATRRNLVALGFPVSETVDTLLMQDERPDYVSDKSSRRAEVAKSFRIVLLVGDDLNDFVSGARALPDERAAVAERHARRWGRSWFLLPNPDYGSWERALYGNERGLSQAEILKRKLGHLRTPK
jgi:5'-nucleotidase (lipoprotein e(P4) family)